jgi:hypothetical protein
MVVPVLIMGLFVVTARFEGKPPTEEAFRAALVSEIGSLDALETFSVEGDVVEVATMMDPVTYPYATKVLLQLGGTLMSKRAGEPVKAKLPGYTARRWVDLPWWRRAGIRVTFLLGLAWEAIPTQEKVF